MRIENQQLKDFLLDSGLIDSEKVLGTFEEAQKQKKLLGDLLLEKKLISEIELRKL